MLYSAGFSGHLSWNWNNCWPDDTVLVLCWALCAW